MICYFSLPLTLNGIRQQQRQRRGAAKRGESTTLLGFEADEFLKRSIHITNAVFGIIVFAKKFSFERTGLLSVQSQ
jgi:hypothetical protein